MWSMEIIEIKNNSNEGVSFTWSYPRYEASIYIRPSESRRINIVKSSFVTSRYGGNGGFKIRWGIADATPLE